MKPQLARLILRAAGWQCVGTPPTASKFVMIAAPHTTNWDGVLMLLAASAMGIHISWMGKNTLFRPPFGALMRGLGGVPVDRTAPHGLVGEMVAAFAERDALILAIPPEGSRKRVDFWKSGFYRIALEAKVPIAFGFLDYANKRCGFGPAIMPSGDMHADMDAVRAFYEGIAAKYPDLVGPVRLKDEANAAGNGATRS